MGFLERDFFSGNSRFCYTLQGPTSALLCRNGQRAMLENTVFIQGQQIRMDWINKIQQGTENGRLTCTIWLSVGPVSVYTFKGREAETAFQLVANHPAFEA